MIFVGNANSGDGKWIKCTHNSNGQWPTTNELTVPADWHNEYQTPAKKKKKQVKSYVHRKGSRYFIHDLKPLWKPRDPDTNEKKSSHPSLAPLYSTSIFSASSRHSPDSSDSNASSPSHPSLSPTLSSSTSEEIDYLREDSSSEEDSKSSKTNNSNCSKSSPPQKKRQKCSNPSPSDEDSLSKHSKVQVLFPVSGFDWALLFQKPKSTA
jgi:hypothetical protein